MNESAARLRILGARQHNLKNLDLEIPHDAFVVITGPSGSGKSSLAVDTIYAEGQRRYLMGVSAHARRFLERLPRPDVTALEGLRPAVSVARKRGRPGARSTVGTSTEVVDYLRLLFARAGRVYCDGCGKEVPVRTIGMFAESLAGERGVVIFPVTVPRGKKADLVRGLEARGYSRLWSNGELGDLGTGLRVGQTGWVVQDRLRVSRTARLVESIEAALVEGGGRAGVLIDGNEPRWFRPGRACGECDAVYPEPEPRHFSFNSPAGACAECRGFGHVLEPDLGRIVPRPSLSLDEGAIHPWAGKYQSWFRRKLEASPTARRIPRDRPWSQLVEADRRLLLEGGDRFPGVFPFLRKLAAKSYKRGARFLVQRYRSAVPCPLCHGTRLGPAGSRVRVDQATLPQWCDLPVVELSRRLRGLELAPSAREAVAALLPDLERRVSILERVGLGYLTLSRLTRTLSGGEMQRIELAQALGAKLTGALYVLDEPTVGLHPRDTGRLLEVLRDLQALDNSVLVVEHDLDVIRQADWMIELGPGSGTSGGDLVFNGPASERHLGPASSTLEAMEKPPSERRPALRSGSGALRLRDVRLHNLRRLDVDLPWGVLIGVCGVSGSGKSSLIRGALVPHLEARLGDDAAPVSDPRLGTLDLDAPVRGCSLVDQAPMARLARSVPASYVGAWDAVRRLYASLPDSKARGLAPGWFSFNVAGGRCETCKGEGEVTVDMDFMADVRIPCEACDGRRFSSAVEAVRYRGRSVVDVLRLTVDEALVLFASNPSVARPLWHLQRVGLGYLPLGQPAATLSGGESQRLKLVRSIARRETGRLIVLDEPTVGLHAVEVGRLVKLLHELVDAGNGVVVIEHHLDVLASCDWMVELGPGGGEEGGRILTQGPPEAAARSALSGIGPYLAPRMEAGRGKSSASQARITP